MPLQRGEDVIIGVGLEADRGTAATIQSVIPATSPSGIQPMVEKTLIRETRATKISTVASEFNKRRAEGDLAFRARVESMGYFLKSLLGKCTSTVKGGETLVYEHLFEVLLLNPQHPVLTIGLSQPNNQDYNYLNTLISSLDLSVTPDDLVNLTANMISAQEVVKSDPAYGWSDEDMSATDYYFRHYDATVKLATNVAGLAAADALPLKTFDLSVANNGRPDHNIGELSPNDILALMIEPTGSFSLQQLDTAYHDIFMTGVYRAMSVTLTRSDVSIGNGSNPSIEFVFPKISFENWSPDRPLDDVVLENIEFTAHYDSTEEEALHATITNTLAEYVSADES